MLNSDFCDNKTQYFILYNRHSYCRQSELCIFQNRSNLSRELFFCASGFYLTMMHSLFFFLSLLCVKMLKIACIDNSIFQFSFSYTSVHIGSMTKAIKHTSYPSGGVWLNCLRANITHSLSMCLTLQASGYRFEQYEKCHTIADQHCGENLYTIFGAFDLNFDAFGNVLVFYA